MKRPSRAVPDWFLPGIVLALVLGFCFSDAGLQARARGISPVLVSVVMFISGLSLRTQDLLRQAVEYETALASVSADPPAVERSPDDLYILYTGGTTGMPKGVLWRQSDIFVAALGGRSPDGTEFTSLDDIIERARGGGARMLPSPPLMHGAAHWASFLNFHAGNPVVIQSVTDRLDPHDIFSTIEREKVTALLIVGDAFARPLLDHLDRQTYDLSSLAVLVTGGAPLNATLKQEFLEKLPDVLLIYDLRGSLEAGRCPECGTGFENPMKGEAKP